MAHYGHEEQRHGRRHQRSSGVRRREDDNHSGNRYVRRESQDVIVPAPSASLDPHRRPRTGVSQHRSQLDNGIPMGMAQYSEENPSHNYSWRSGQHSNLPQTTSAGGRGTLSTHGEQEVDQAEAPLGYPPLYMGNGTVVYPPPDLRGVAGHFAQVELNFPSHDFVSPDDAILGDQTPQPTAFPGNYHGIPPATTFDTQDVDTMLIDERRPEIAVPPSHHTLPAPIGRPPQDNNLQSRVAYKIRGDAGGTQLNPRFEVQRNARDFFVVGRVFKILWHEGRGQNGTIISEVTNHGQFSRGRYGEEIHSNIRRMVVVKPHRRWAWCLPITTYGGQGVAKNGVAPSDHAIMYMRGTRPARSDDEPRMTKEPLEVEPDEPEERLDYMSRLNFGKVYTVEHNVKVFPVGIISRNSITLFKDYARAEFNLRY